ncbi:MAG: hypothetical protein DRH20_01765 [Deltaproteobacteria bacterium]|nr:MAG: hypothetical protein DRH20_01765 [Deltaproteobacteria bacterium]
MARHVLRPILRLRNATLSASRGIFVPIRDEEGRKDEVADLVAAFNRMAKELEAREEKIVHSRKIASLGTLVSGIAHELNNPINNIVLTVDSLISGRKIPEEKKAELLDDILGQAMRASEIVKNLLEFSRAETSAYRELDLVRLLRETMKIAENHINVSKVRLHDEIPDTLPSIYGNRRHRVPGTGQGKMPR